MRYKLGESQDKYKWKNVGQFNIEEKHFGVEQ